VRFGSSYPFRPIRQSIGDLLELGLHESALDKALTATRRGCSGSGQRRGVPPARTGAHERSLSQAHPGRRAARALPSSSEANRSEDGISG